jgi:hypothetical protein
MKRNGMVLSEVVVALALLAGAVVTLAGLFGVASRSARTARASTQCAILAAQKVEQLRALSWGVGDDGEDASDFTTNLSAWPEVPGGTGLAASPTGALAANLPGFVDYLDDGGAWLGNGTAPPPATAFVRRWSIEPLADSPLDTLVVRVVVTSVASPAFASLTAVRTKRGQ